MLPAVEQVFFRHRDLPLGLRDSRVRPFEIGLGNAQGFSGFVRIGLRHGLSGNESALPSVIELCLREHRLRAGEIGADSFRRLLRRRQCGLRDSDLLAGFRIIEPGEQLAGFHHVPLIHQHLVQPALNARTDSCLYPRLKRARAHDFTRYFPFDDGVRQHRQRTEFDVIDK